MVAGSLTSPALRRCAAHGLAAERVDGLVGKLQIPVVVRAPLLRSVATAALCEVRLLGFAFARTRSS